MEAYGDIEAFYLVKDIVNLQVCILPVIRPENPSGHLHIRNHGMSNHRNHQTLVLLSPPLDFTATDYSDGIAKAAATMAPTAATKSA